MMVHTRRATRGRATPSADAKRIQELERELRRKDHALAETAALLVLKKQLVAIWGDADASTTWVCSQEHHTLYAMEQGSREGAVCASTAEVVQFFGYGVLAKQLYAVAGINCAEAIA